MRMGFQRFTGLVVAAVLLGGIAIGCDKDANAKWYGTYTNTKDKSTLVLEKEHKGSLEMEGKKMDVTWEVTGEDKASVKAGIPIEVFRNSDGSLRDEEGTVWKKA